jgi:hypothetical protein
MYMIIHHLFTVFSIVLFSSVSLFAQSTSVESISAGSSFLSNESRIQTTTRIVYIDVSAPNGGDGTSWATAYNSIQDAFDNETPTSDDYQFWVAAGEYNETITDAAISENCILLGGFRGNETLVTARDVNTNRTYINFSATFNHFSVDGFVFRQGASFNENFSPNTAQFSNNIVMVGFSTFGTVNILNNVFTGFTETEMLFQETSISLSAPDPLYDGITSDIVFDGNSLIRAGFGVTAANLTGGFSIIESAGYVAIQTYLIADGLLQQHFSATGLGPPIGQELLRPEPGSGLFEDYFNTYYSHYYTISFVSSPSSPTEADYERVITNIPLDYDMPNTIHLDGNPAFFDYTGSTINFYDNFFSSPWQNILGSNLDVENVAPQYYSGYPISIGTSATSTQIDIRVHKGGTCYYVVVPSGENEPTSLQVKNGQDASGSAASISGSTTVASDFSMNSYLLTTLYPEFDVIKSDTLTISGLTQGTAYDVYLIVEGSNSLYRSHAEKIQIQTLALPTATDSSLVFTENSSQSFGVNGFGFSDADAGDQLETLQIISLPSKGTFFLDVNDNQIADDAAISVNQNISRSDLSSNRLLYKAATGEYGKAYDSFTFKVSDGQNLSANTYTMTIDVHATQESIPGTGTLGGWRMLGAPSTTETYSTLLSGMWTQGATGASTTDYSPNVYTWQESSASFAPVLDLTATITNGNGLVMYIYADDDALDGQADVDGGWPKAINHSGTNKTGTTSFPITFTDRGQSTDGFNLVSNPYPFAIDWDAAQGWTKTNMGGSIYIWNPNANAGIGNYEVWNGVTGALGNGEIAPYQAFWVFATAAGPILEATEDVGLSTSVDLQKTQVNNAPIIIELEVRQNGNSDKVYLMFTENGMVGYDNLDAWKLKPLSSSFIQIASVTENKAQSISNLPTDVDINQFEIPIDIESSTSGSLSIKLSKTSGLPEDWKPVLFDTITGKEAHLWEGEELQIEYEVAKNSATMKQSSEKEMNIQPQLTGLFQSSLPRLKFALSPKVLTSMEDSFLVKEYSLSQNYPNPFNPSTTIQFSMKESNQVKVAVYDILGKQVALLQDGVLQQGKHKVQFDASSLSSGIYFYRMTVSGIVFTKKMLLVK